MNDYEEPKLKSYGTVSDLTADCDIPPLADEDQGQAGTACSPG
jgi:hypothetical protein